MNNAKKWKKTIEWKRLEISSNWRIKRTFHARTGTLNHRNGKDLTEESKKRCKEYTELYKKGLNDLDNHDGVITYLECVECEVHTHTLPGM